MLLRQCWGADLESDVLLTAYGAGMYLFWLHRKVIGDRRPPSYVGYEGVTGCYGPLIGLKSYRMNRIITKKIQQNRPDCSLLRCEDQS